MSSATPRVSVVIPAYNAEGHLERAVTSALAQTLAPVEVLVIDDASTDGSLSLARRLATAHPSVRVLALEENAGPARARNAGFDAATGTWIAILDADDVFSPGRLASLVDVAEREAADVVFDNFVFVRAADGTARPSRIPAGTGHEQVEVHRFLRAARAFNYEPDWTLLQPVLRRDFLEAHGLRYPTAIRHGEDFLFIMDVLLSGARCVRVKNPGYLYTERAGGWSTTTIDYPGMVQQASSLLQDPRVAGDAFARRLLRRRASTLRCVHAARQGKRHLLLAAVTKPGVAATLARRAGRRALRAFSRPALEQLPPLL